MKKLRVFYFIGIILRIAVFCNCFFLFKIFSAEDDICGKDFQEIEKKCIDQSIIKVKPRNIPLSQINSGDVFIYKTDSGNVGKLFIISVENQKEGKSVGTCSLYLESETYGKVSNFVTNTSLSITNKLGLWETREINFDSQNSKYDFSLESVHSKKNNADVCYLKSLNGEIYFLKNIPQSPQNSGSIIIYIAAILCIAFAAFLISYTIFKDEGEFAVHEKLEEHEEGKQQIDYKKYGIIYRYSRPFVKRYFSPVVQGMKGVQKIKSRYKRKIANAGISKMISPEDFFAFKLFLIIGFPLVFLAIRQFMEASWPLGFTVMVACLGFVYPDIWLKLHTQKRREEIIYSMPFIVDMLALSIEAGLDFMAAIARVIEKAPPSALVDEFQNVIKDIRIGSSRGDALRQLSWRVDEIVVNSFCATLIAADSVGASVGPVLKSLSNEIRQKRSALIEQAGAKAATKILVPMILLIVPAVFIIVMAPPIMEALK